MFSFPVGRAPSPGGIASLTPRPTAPAPIPPQIMAKPTAMSPMTQRGMTQQVMPSNRTPSMISAFRNGPARAQLDAFRQMRAGANPRPPYGKTGAATSPVPSMAAPQPAAPQMFAPAVMPMAPDAGMQQAYSGFQSASPVGVAQQTGMAQNIPQSVLQQMASGQATATAAPSQGMYETPGPAPTPFLPGAMASPMTQAQAQAQMDALMGQSAPTLGMAAGGQVSSPVASSQSNLQLATTMRTGTPEERMAALEKMRSNTGVYSPFGIGVKGAPSAQQPEQSQGANSGFIKFLEMYSPQTLAQLNAARMKTGTTTAT